MIPAGSPQAKGRIERLWETLQDRLVQEFIINGIKGVEAANKFMAKYLSKFNLRFSVSPKGDPVFRKLDRDINLDYILCRKEPRKLDSGSAFSYKGKYYQLVSDGKVAATIPRSRVTVLTGKRTGIKASYSGKVYSVARLEARPKVASDLFKAKPKTRRLPKKLAANHPWRSSYPSGFRYDRSDLDIAKGLFDSSLAWNPDNQ
ncbi:MAG: hypothetical protein WA105_00340 [Candidatus Hydromicrobium sp.]